MKRVVLFILFVAIGYGVVALVGLLGGSIKSGHVSLVIYAVGGLAVLWAFAKRERRGEPSGSGEGSFAGLTPPKPGREKWDPAAVRSARKRIRMKKLKARESEGKD